MRHVLITAAALGLTCATPAGATMMELQLSGTVKNAKNGAIERLTIDVTYDTTESPYAQFSVGSLAVWMFDPAAAWVDLEGHLRRDLVPAWSHINVADEGDLGSGNPDRVSFILQDGPGAKSWSAIEITFQDGEALSSAFLPGIQPFQDQSIFIDFFYYQGVYFWPEEMSYTITQLPKLGGPPKVVVSGPVIAAPIASAPVPEPASWASMLAGFLLVGAAVRSSRRNTVVRYETR